MSKPVSGHGRWCSGGEPPFNAGNYIRREDSGIPGAPILICTFCERVVRRLKDGSVGRHVSQRASESEKPGVNSQASRAARAFDRTRG